MDLRFVLGFLHLLTFGLGFAACWGRARALRKLNTEADTNDVFLADNLWGIAAMLWIVTGLWRAFGGVEKGTDYYIHNTAFLVKMGLFFLILLLELKPMITLIRWRIQLRKGIPLDLSSAPLMARLTYLELLILVPMVILAVAVARGIFY